MKFISLLTCLSFIGLKAQVLHHQAVLSQGSKTLTQSGFVVSQSIGQISPSGTFKNPGVVVQQGFQQYAVTKYNITSNDIVTRVYPNPFVSSVSFEFSQVFDSEVQFSLFDLAGKLIIRLSKKPTNKVLEIDLNTVFEGHYLVLLSVEGYNYGTKIIKTNQL
jgi:Secretion system C-terminal sorting domain